MRRTPGQGATEYLVLLAVVLVIALVGIALLGFFPGTASEAQVAQSLTYWKSASPIQIVESAARTYSPDGATYIYLRVRNAGSYPIRLTAIIGADGWRAPSLSCDTPVCCSPTGVLSIANYFYLAPSEEKQFSNWLFGSACDYYILPSTGGSGGGGYVFGGATSVCQNSTASPGTLSYKNLGFEYVEYIEGQQITKTQIGKAFVLKCLPPV